MTKENYGVYLNNDIFRSLHNVLSNDHTSITGSKPIYCSYINYWLNKVVQTTDKLCYKKSGNYDDSCKSYIFDLGAETVNKMNFLYELYDVYNEIISDTYRKNTAKCNELFLLSRNYYDSIYKYYNTDNDLYDKLENIKSLIEGIIGRTKYCTQNIYFTKPTNLVNLLKAEQERREAEEREKQAQEEAARQAKDEAVKKQKEEQYLEKQELLQYNDLFSISRENHVQEMHQENQDLHSTKYRGGSHELGNTGLNNPPRTLFGHSGMSESSPGGSITHTIEGTNQQREVGNDQEDKGTTRSGTFFNSSGFRGYITEVLDSVDPVPVVGVSGGMGALYLLLKVWYILNHKYVYIKFKLSLLQN
ncbi:CYIR protein [Plasmodium cynomolgi strain B]|uniref:CYIR protein n=1 Tax=Plasmodium cynomolgi (strain B) TaxID=1120755 RepID=K6VK32_PLACD|nr:CYIR protein [Plasmodium cynomolgi strain B]GAB69797.1 CYIR protein [Plasmodium cynomolgi strain B]